jgi:endonuclease YncB( thermonuclease family)
VKKRVFILFLVAQIATKGSAWAGSLVGVVVGVSDGDTLTLVDDRRIQHKVRLAGIDAPEKKQDFGQRAKQNLSAMTYGRQVTVDGNKTDRYGRFVGKVMIGGVDVNLRQIELGFAWFYRDYERELTLEDRMAYASAECAAREAKKGLWRLPSPQPPWEFRRGPVAAPTLRPPAAECGPTQLRSVAQA